MDGMNKKIVIPGELLSSNPSLSGAGTYVSGGNVYASVCGLLNQKGKLSVHPFSGPYIPKKNDFILGYVTVVTPSNWIFDIGCPYEGLLHVSEYPIRVPSEDMEKHFDVRDTVLLKVTDVNAEMKVELTYKDPACRKLAKGCLFEVSFSKVSRIIGHSGTMISMLKSKTGCDIFVGSNGRIWMNGSSDDINILIRSLQKIEKDAHLSGLTDLTAAFINEQYDLIGLKPHDFVPAEEFEKPSKSEKAKTDLQKQPASEEPKPDLKKARHKKLKKSADEKEIESDAQAFDEPETEAEIIDESKTEAEVIDKKKRKSEARATGKKKRKSNADDDKESEADDKTETETEADDETETETDAEDETESEADAEDETESEADAEDETESEADAEDEKESKSESKSSKKAVVKKETGSKTVKENAVKEAAVKKESSKKETKETTEGKVVEKKRKGSGNAKSGTKTDAKKSEKAKSEDVGILERNNCVCFKSVRFSHPHPHPQE